MSERMYYSKEAELRAQAERTFLAILFTGLGLSIGAALALLFAPVKGEQLRGELSEKIDKTRSNFEEYGEHAKKALSN